MRKWGQIIFLSITQFTTGYGEAQRHYLKVIRPSAIIGFTATLPTNVLFYKGSALEAKRDQETEIRFLSTAAGHLQGTEWNGLLDRLTGDLKGR